MAETLRGIGVSAGFAAGPAYQVASPPRLPEPEPVGDVEAELSRALDALAAVAADLARRADATGDATAAEILRAESMMANDPELRDAVSDKVRAGTDAPHAIDV